VDEDTRRLASLIKLIKVIELIEEEAQAELKHVAALTKPTAACIGGGSAGGRRCSYTSA
jgi:hypothetical protein